MRRLAALSVGLDVCSYRRARHLHVTVNLPIQDKTMFQMTALCLSASFCFLVCVTPSMVLLIGKPYWNDPPADWYAIAKSITNQVPVRGLSAFTRPRDKLALCSRARSAEKVLSLPV